jgi:hypothetical protein
VYVPPVNQVRGKRELSLKLSMIEVSTSSPWV